MKLDKPQCKTCAAKANSIFCHVADATLQGLEQHKSHQHFKRGEIVFHEGSPSLGLYCIFNGNIKIYKSGSGGRETILRLAKPGDILGYHSFLSGNGYIATAAALEDVQLCFIDKNYFQQLVRQQPAMALGLLQKLGDEVRDSYDRINQSQNHSARQRLAYLLLNLNATYGKVHERGSHLDIKLSRAEIAAMLSTTPETVMRLLRDFSDHRYVHLMGKNIIVADVDGLLQASGIEA